MMLRDWTRTYAGASGAPDARGRVSRERLTESVRGRRYAPKRSRREIPSSVSVVEAEAVVKGASDLLAGDVLTDELGHDWEVVEALWLSAHGLSHYSAGLKRVRGQA